MPNTYETNTRPDTAAGTRTKTTTRRQRIVRRVVVGTAVIITPVLLISGFVLNHAINGRPANAPDALRGTAAVAEEREVLVLAGASTIQGTISADWVSGLYDTDMTVVNAGINGHTTEDLLNRLDRDVIDLNPDHVVLLVGTNDVRGDIDPEETEVNVGKILDRLESETDANIALMSLQPIGEQVDSDLNAEVNAYNAVLKAQADTRGLAYLGLNEAITAKLTGDAPDFTFPVVQTAFDLFLFDKEFIEISESHGLQYLVDNVHLNERGAAIAGDLTTEWLEQVR